MHLLRCVLARSLEPDFLNRVHALVSLRDIELPLHTQAPFADRRLHPKPHACLRGSMGLRLMPNSCALDHHQQIK